MTAADDAPEYLIGRIHKALATDHRTGELELDVRLAAGRIFLTGSVATPVRRAAVEEVVGETAPGHEVVNELTVAGEDQPGREERLP